MSSLPEVEPQRFEFFQLVRLLEQEARRTGKGRPLGYDGSPHDDLARFRVDPALAFAPSSVKVGRKRAQGETFEVSFCGAIGALGVLPQHYTELAVERRHLKDESLIDFLDLLHQRVVAFFYRAWLKYRLPFSYEHADRWSLDSDGVTKGLLALVGLGTGRLSERPPERPEPWLYFAGLFARPARTAHGVEGIVGDVMNARARVEQFVGKWVELDEEERSRLTSREQPEGVHAQLGRAFVVGERVWDKTSCIRVIAGPLDAGTFRRFQPRMKSFEVLVDLVRSYVGPQIDVDYVWEVDTEGLGPVRLGAGSGPEARLGWTTWLGAPQSGEYDSRIPIWLDKARAVWEHSRL